MSDVMTEAQLSLETERLHAQIALFIEEGAKLRAETAKLHAERRKYAAEAVWYPIGIATGLVAAVATLTGLVIHLIT